MVRVRGLHLDEANATIQGSPISGGLMDLVLTSLLTAKDLSVMDRLQSFMFQSVSTIRKQGGGTVSLMRSKIISPFQGQAYARHF